LEIKTDKFLLINFNFPLEMLRPNFDKKSSHCQQQAINTLQNIFPSVNLSQFSKHSSVWEVLEVPHLLTQEIR
jgi:hypothetical protein